MRVVVGYLDETGSFDGVRPPKEQQVQGLEPAKYGDGSRNQDGTQHSLSRSRTVRFHRGRLARRINQSARAAAIAP